jgi:hypothetical protein
VVNHKPSSRLHSSDPPKNVKKSVGSLLSQVSPWTVELFGEFERKMRREREREREN